MKVYLVRHAEAHSNVRETVPRPTSDTLTYEGISQLTGLSRFFVQNDIKKIYTSPILRAKETARGMTLQEVPVEEWEELRERKGVFEVSYRFSGLSQEKIIEAVRTARDGYREWVPEHDESFESIRARVLKVKRRLEGNPLSSVALVSHLGFLSILLAFMIYGDDTTEEIVVAYMHRTQLPNASVSAVEYVPEQHQWEVLSVGDTSFSY